MASERVAPMLKTRHSPKPPHYWCRSALVVVIVLGVLGATVFAVVGAKTLTGTHVQLMAAACFAMLKAVDRLPQDREPGGWRHS
jgi:hypothetical protein